MYRFRKKNVGHRDLKRKRYGGAVKQRHRTGGGKREIAPIFLCQEERRGRRPSIIAFLSSCGCCINREREQESHLFRVQPFHFLAYCSFRRGRFFAFVPACLTLCSDLSWRQQHPLWRPFVPFYLTSLYPKKMRGTCYCKGPFSPV